MKNSIPKLEQKVIAIALVFIGVMIGLIGYAAYRLGISVPTCVTTVKPFTEGALIKQGENRYEAHIYARMWRFEPNVIRLPTGSTVDFYLSSRDITHGFHIADTNVNLMAVPGSVNYAQMKFRKPGQYRITCHEYCGTGHHGMNAIIEVSDVIQEGSAEGLVASLSPELETHPGKALLEDNGCLACHSLDGTAAVGPSLRSLWGRKEELTDGTIIPSVDRAYLKTKIQDPSKTTVKGFESVMPPVPMSEADVNTIIDFIEKLK